MVNFWKLHNTAERVQLAAIAEGEWTQQALRQIKSDYGVDARLKYKSLLKYGKTANADSGVLTTVMTLPDSLANESYLTDNLITTVSSSSSSDAGLGLTVEGHYFDGNGNKVFVVQTVTLDVSDGRTQVSLTTPLARATRCYVSGAAPAVGNIYFYEDDTTTTLGVPDTDAGVPLIQAAGKNQSEKAATAFSQDDYCLITGMAAGLARDAGSTVTADIEIQFSLDNGVVFRDSLEFPLRVTGNQSQFIPFEPFIVIPANADVRITGTTNTNNTTLYAFFNSTLAIDQDATQVTTGLIT